MHLTAAAQRGLQLWGEEQNCQSCGTCEESTVGIMLAQNIEISIDV